MTEGSGASGSSARVAPPPLLVTTRFGLGIKDPAWLDHRLILISSITASSLLAQHDQNFRWGVFVDPDLQPGVRKDLEDALAPFEGRAVLRSVGRYGTGPTLTLADELGVATTDGHLLTGRIDDDDAWNREVVGAVRERANRWLEDRRQSPGVGITFEYGFEWVMYQMLDVDALQKHGRTIRRPAAIRGYVYPFLGTSVFILSKLSDRVTALSASHSRMGEWLTENGYDVDIVATDRPMWLYCRHKQVGSSIHKSNSDDMEVALADLVAEFGLDEARTARYLASADRYGYGVVKRPMRHRKGMQKEVQAINLRLKDSTITAVERADLKRRKVVLEDEMAEVAANVVGELDESGR